METLLKMLSWYHYFLLMASPALLPTILEQDEGTGGVGKSNRTTFPNEGNYSRGTVLSLCGPSSIFGGSLIAPSHPPCGVGPLFLVTGSQLRKQSPQNRGCSHPQVTRQSLRS